MHFKGAVSLRGMCILGLRGMASLHPRDQRICILKTYRMTTSFDERKDDILLTGTPTPRMMSLLNQRVQMPRVVDVDDDVGLTRQVYGRDESLFSSGARV